MELRDLYDKNGNLTGEVIEKDKIVPNNRCIKVVLSFMENSEGKYLIQYTSPLKDSVYASTGGHPKHGESSLEGIVTEVKEELGIDIPKKEFVLVESGIKNNVIFDLYYIKIDINLDDVILQKEEVESVSYLTVEEIKKLIEDGKFRKSHGYAFEKIQDYKKHIL